MDRFSLTAALDTYWSRRRAFLPRPLRVHAETLVPGVLLSTPGNLVLPFLPQTVEAHATHVVYVKIGGPGLKVLPHFGPLLPDQSQLVSIKHILAAPGEPNLDAIFYAGQTTRCFRERMRQDYPAGDFTVKRVLIMGLGPFELDCVEQLVIG